MPRFIAVHPGSFKEQDLADLPTDRGTSPLKRHKTLNVKEVVTFWPVCATLVRHNGP